MSDVPAPPQLAALLRTARRRYGLSQPAMAELLAVSLRQYQRWEHGVSEPRARAADRVLGMVDADPRAPRRARALEDEVALLRREVDRLHARLARLESRLEPADAVA